MPNKYTKLKKWDFKMPIKRKVTAREFFIHVFKKDPSHWAERKYFAEWKQRFATGHPEYSMGTKALKIYHKLQRKRLPYPKSWKGIGGGISRIVQVYPKIRKKRKY